MQRISILLGASLLLAPSIQAAEQTWAGEISDSACNMKHESGAENVPAPPAKECVAACVRGGSKYVLLAGGKILQIDNQQAPGLGIEQLAGVDQRGAGVRRGGQQG